MSNQSFTYNDDAKSLTSNAFTRAGYTFSGWNTAANGSGTSYTNGQGVRNLTTTHDATVTLYAQWTVNTYTVTYNLNDDNIVEATISSTSKPVTYASTYGTLPTPTRRFYTFDGWFTAATGGSQVTSSTTVTITSNQTLYAHWTLVPESQTLSWGNDVLFLMARDQRQPIVVSSDKGFTTFTYSSSDESKIAIDGEYLVAKANGTAVITVTQPGNTYIKPATLKATFTVLSKETPNFTENGFSEGETCNLKVDDAVTLNVANVSAGLNGDFTVVAAKKGNVIGIERVGNAITFTALHAGKDTITVTQTENDDIYGATRTYIFDVTRYVPVFTLSDNDLELDETATLTLENTDGASITFSPEGKVNYNGATGIVTAVAPGTTTLTVSQAQTNSIAAKEETFNITVSKKTPTLTVKMNGSVRTSLSVSRGSKATVSFEKVSDAEITVTNVSGSQYASYVNDTMTAGAVGSAVYRASLPETDTYKATHVDFTLTVTANSSHLPVSIASESAFNTLKSGTSGDVAWKGSDGICVGGYNGWTDGVADWNDKYVEFHFAGVPDKLTFDYKFIYRDNILNKMTATAPGGSTVAGQLYFLYVDESADGKTWSAIWNDQVLNKDNWQSCTKQLKKTTRYVRFHLHANYGALYKNIQISELTYLENPEPASIDFGSAIINSATVSRTANINWCNLAPVTVTSSNPRILVSPASFGNFDNYATQTITLNYTPSDEDENVAADITLSNGNNTYNKTIHVTAATVRRPQTITWNADLVSTGYAMNVGEQYPDEVLTTIATATNAGRITYTSDHPEIVEVVADTALRAKAVGTANITAHQAGDAEYQAIDDTKEFTVTLLQKQSITWEQNLYGLLTTSSPVTLTATATSGGEITYVSADANVVKVEGNVLTVVHDGETYITATQAGGVDEEGNEWLPVSARNYVIVRDPASQCNGLALSQSSLTLKNDEREFALSGIPQILTFTVKHGSKSSLWGTAPSYAPLIVEQWTYRNNHWDWVEVYNSTASTDNVSSGNITLDESATKLKFSTIESGTDYTISNIRVTRKKFMRVDVESVSLEVENNTAWSQEVTVSHSNIDVMTISSKQGIVNLSSSTLGEGCGSFGDDVFTVSFTPTIKNHEYKDTVVITDAKAEPTTIRIPVRLYSRGLNQSISGFSLPTACVATVDTITFRATASSELEVAYISSDSTIAYVNDAKKLVILRDGSVTITAVQEGNEKYDAATPIAKTIVITKAATSITKAPTAATITYGQTLAASTLTGGEASVAGTFAWETPDAVPAAGTPNYNVVFTPSQSGIYATSTTLVGVRVEKATPVINTYPTASDITIAQALSNSELTGGVASVAGTFVWKNPSESRLPFGDYERTVVFIPNDDNNYNRVEITVGFKVLNVLAKINEMPTPVVESPVYGMTLADVTLEGGSANVAGEFQWVDETTVLLAGTHDYAVVFVPEDLELYSPVNVSVSLTAAKLTPSVSAWPVAAALTYGQALGASALTGGEGSVDGAFVWEDAANTILAAGNHTLAVLFVPADTDNYNTIDGEADLTVNTAALTVTADDREVTFGDAAPAYTVSYEGFVNGEDVSALGGELAVACDYPTGSEIYARFTITPSGLTSGNYAIEFVAGTLTVNPKTKVLNPSDANPWAGMDEHTSVTVGSVVSIDSEVTLYSLEITEGSKVVIAPNGGLTLGAGGITGADADSLVIEASSTTGQTGYIRISPDYTGEMPQATVQLFSEAYNNNVDKTEWQYVGIPIETDALAKSIYTGNWLMTWYENTGEWKNERRTLVMEPFVGYATSQKNNEAGVMIAHKGQLVDVRTPVEVSLTCTPGSPAQGWNLLANSFAAPIDITRLETTDFPDASNAAVYIYNTGSLADKQARDEAGVENTSAAGQYITVTPGTAAAIHGSDASYPVVIPPMQGFLVYTETAGTMTLDYEKLVWDGAYGNQPMRAPKRYTQPEQSELVKLTLYSPTTSDHLYLLASDQYVRDYENGTDARKRMSDNEDLPGIFAIEGVDHLAIDATSDLAGTQIGVRTGNETMYTIHFSHLTVDGELLLRDLDEDQTTLISEGAEYTFFAPARTMLTSRFVIERAGASENANVATGVSNTQAAQTLICQVGSEVRIAADEASCWALYNVEGKLVETAAFRQSAVIDLSRYAEGVYLVRVGQTTAKVIR